MNNHTIGFIGYGNMAQAIARRHGRRRRTRTANDIVACAAHYDKLERNAAKFGIRKPCTPPRK